MLLRDISFQRGAESRDNFFNNKDLTKFEANNAAVLIYDGDLNNYTDIMPALHAISKVDCNSVQLRDQT